MRYLGLILLLFAVNAHAVTLDGKTIATVDGKIIATFNGVTLTAPPSSNLANYSFEGAGSGSLTSWVDGGDNGGLGVTVIAGTGLGANSGHVARTATFTASNDSNGPYANSLASIGTAGTLKTQLSDFADTFSFDWRWNGTGSYTGVAYVSIRALNSSGVDITGIALSDLVLGLSTGGQNANMRTITFSTWKTLMSTAMATHGGDSAVKKISVQFIIYDDSNSDFTYQFWVDEVKI
jgi:hypothetical protein